MKIIYESEYHQAIEFDTGKELLAYMEENKKHKIKMSFLKPELSDGFVKIYACLIYGKLRLFDGITKREFATIYDINDLAFPSLWYEIFYRKLMKRRVGRLNKDV